MNAVDFAHPHSRRDGRLLTVATPDGATHRFIVEAYHRPKAALLFLQIFDTSIPSGFLAYEPLFARGSRTLNEEAFDGLKKSLMQPTQPKELTHEHT